jgi:hypothetical protein
MTLSFIAFKKSSLRLRWLCVSFGFYILALLSKQVALALPVLLLIEELVFSRPEGKAFKRLLAAVSVYLMVPVLGFVFMLADFKLFARFPPPDFFDHSYLQILATQMSYYPLYLKLAFLPSHLTIDHYVRYAQGFMDLRAGLGLVAFVLSLALVFNQPAAGHEFHSQQRDHRGEIFICALAGSRDGSGLAAHQGKRVSCRLPGIPEFPHGFYRPVGLFGHHIVDRQLSLLFAR